MSKYLLSNLPNSTLLICFYRLAPLYIDLNENALIFRLNDTKIYVEFIIFLFIECVRFNL